MNDVVINSEGLGKKYLIGHRAERARYQTIRDALGRSAVTFGRSITDMLRGRQIIAGDIVEEFWALKNISFEVHRSEVIGFIGRNGAGKTTLLKVLSRITEPSAGRVVISGRVASLLEVGTGFHPELTGRENIFLNGAILGMTRQEIRRKFDEIIAFAEVEKFIDTPVKRFSSGMYVRLAFAVAAHLEPEILIVDEVLAVGDATFQKKCLGKLSDVARSGRTVLFVSHNMGAVERLCTRSIVLQDGETVFDGDTTEAVKHYLTHLAADDGKLPAPSRRPGTGKARITCVRYDQVVDFGMPLSLTVALSVEQPLRSPDVRFSIYNDRGVCVANFCASYLTPGLPDIATDTEITLEIPASPLNLGSYTVGISIAEWRLAHIDLVDRIEDAATFEVASVDPFGTGEHPKIGSVILRQRWLKDGALVSEYSNAD